jgi:hypothetical protein
MKSAAYKSWRSGFGRRTSVAMASDSEEESPIPKETVTRISAKGVVVNVISPKSDSAKEYELYLRDIEVSNKHKFYKVLEIGPNTFLVVFLVIATLFFISNYISVRCDILEGGCASTVMETKTSIGQRSTTEKSEEDGRNAQQNLVKPDRSVTYSEKILDNKKVDLGILSAFGALVAFLYAVFQWRMENRQSSINEIFQRKKDINFLLMEKEGIRLLLREAVDRVIVENLRSKRIESPKMERVLNRIQSLIYIKNLNSFSFDQKMFVFMELDNLEFALEKYLHGYLDGGQMYRACEIFQSRCYSRAFRYLAMTQGLAYYKDELKIVISCLIVRGHYYETFSLWNARGRDGR